MDQLSLPLFEIFTSLPALARKRWVIVDDPGAGCRSLIEQLALADPDDEFDTDRHGFTIGFTPGLVDDAEDHANARLICLLPELAAAVLDHLTPPAYLVAGLRAALSQATPGTWIVRSVGYYPHQIAAAGARDEVLNATDRAEADFIVAAHNALAELLAAAGQVG